METGGVWPDNLGKEEDFKMDAHDQSEMFYNELSALVDRFKEEFDMTYMQIIGVLEMYKMELFCEAMSVMMTQDEDDDEDDDDFGWKNTNT